MKTNDHPSSQAGYDQTVHQRVSARHRFRALLALGLFFATVGEVQSAYLYFGEFDGARIVRANLDGTGRVTLVSGSRPSGPTLDLARDQMYWGEVSGANIWRANLNGSGQVIVVGGRNGPGAPALDLAGGRMYWNEVSGGQIRRANLDGSDQQVLVTGQNSPRSVVLDVAGGKMYWSEWGAGNIRSANLDGTGLQTLISGLGNPNVIALDLGGRRMYWCNQGSGQIARANLDGSSQEILLQNLNSPIGIALDLDHGHVYWANSSDIRRVNLNGTGEQILITGLSRAGIVTLDLISDGPPLIQLQPQNQAAPLNGNVSFSVGAAGLKPLAYQWQHNGVAVGAGTNATLELGNLAFGNSGSYRVLITNSLGSVTSQVAVLSVSPIAITSQTGNTNVWPGSNVIFQVAITSAIPTSCQWRFNGTNIFGATNLSFSITNVQAIHEGEYTLVLANSFGSVTSAPARLVLLIRPVITQQPQSVTVAVGQSASFSVAVDGTRPLAYRWLKNAVTIIPFDRGTSSLVFDPVVLTNAGRYRVAITNAASITGVASTEAHLVVVVPPANQLAQPGATVTFTAQANGPTPINYQWHFNGAAIPNATSTNLVLTNVQPAQAGSYTLIVSNAQGIATAFPANLTIGAPTLPALTITRSGTNLAIHWPSSAATVLLEQTTSFPAATEDWAIVSGAIQTNGTNVKIIAPAGSRAFFRLRQP